MNLNARAKSEPFNQVKNLLINNCEMFVAT